MTFCDTKHKHWAFMSATMFGLILNLVPAGHPAYHCGLWISSAFVMKNHRQSLLQRKKRAGGARCHAKSGQGPGGAPTGRVCAVGISFSEGETGGRPVPPTRSHPGFYHSFCVSHFFDLVAQDGSTWPNIGPKKCPSWANIDLGGQRSPKMGQPGPQDGPT